MKPFDGVLARDFEFHYLAELTRQRIKPLSRWEKPLDRKTLRWLKRRGFAVATVRRATRTGRPVFETVFGLSSRYVDSYVKTFHQAALRPDPETRRKEGFLFGYPSCCVEQFIRRPYAPNRLASPDQSLLFHWACPDCRATPGLLPYYRTVHGRLTECWNPARHAGPAPALHARRPWLSAAAALLFSTPLFSADTDADTTHAIPVPGDANGNGLTYAEEVWLGAYYYGPADPCRSSAVLFQTTVDTLPDTVQSASPYKIDHWMRGVVECPKCGENVNMGYVTIVHPLRGLQMDIPYLGLHFMEHGYFSYGDDTDWERVDIDTLKRILRPFDPDHRLPVAGDTDGDGLADTEEDSLWMDWTSGIPDFDGNGIPDGADAAEDLVRVFPNLREAPDGAHSRIELFPVWGTETCHICGSEHNMGFIEIINPENGREIQIPFLALHALAHGSFAYHGTEHPNGHVNAVELIRAMKTHLLFIRNDGDRDGLTETEEAYFGLNPDQADTDSDGVPDGAGLAKALADSITALPTEPRTTGPYAEILGMDGVHLCSVCGSEVVMGVIRIFNPLINTADPYEVTNYAFHFLEHGGFAHEGAQNARIDPVLLSQYLNITPTHAGPGPVQTAPGSPLLMQNYPNPFNASTVIAFELPDAAHVTAYIVDAQGRIIRRLMDETRAAGANTVLWDGHTENGARAATGVYVARMQAKGRGFETAQSRKIVMVK